MMRSGSGDDLAALERAAAELHQIARSAREQAGLMDAHAARVKPVAQGVGAIIGGTASGTDKKMVGMLDRAVRDLADSSRLLNEASRTAQRLAQEATSRALAAREAQAAQQSARKR
ncbi:hypothetical protein L2K20_20450 [Mycobacterium sp. MBM]|nr:hypothetical protein [Mycobacterium sp. MBM]